MTHPLCHTNRNKSLGHHFIISRDRWAVVAWHNWLYWRFFHLLSHSLSATWSGAQKKGKKGWLQSSTFKMHCKEWIGTSFLEDIFIRCIKFKAKNMAQFNSSSIQAAENFFYILCRKRGIQMWNSVADNWQRIMALVASQGTAILIMQSLSLFLNSSYTIGRYICSWCFWQTDSKDVSLKNMYHTKNL